MSFEQHASDQEIVRLATRRHTQEYVAEVAGTTRVSVRKWLRGQKYPNRAQYRSILSLLDPSSSPDLLSASQAVNHPLWSAYGDASGFEERSRVVYGMFSDGTVNDEAAVALATQLVEDAETPDEHAIALVRRSGALAHRGFYKRAMEDLDLASLCRGIPVSLRMQIEVNRAGYLNDQDCPMESFGVARSVIEHFEDHPASDLRGQTDEAFAYLTAGYALLRLANREPDRAEALGQKAGRFLRAAGRLYEGIASNQANRDYYASLAKATANAVLVADFEAGGTDLAPIEVVEMLKEQLPVDEEAVGLDLTVAGLAADLASDVVVRHLDGPDRQRELAVLIGKARDIACQSKNWHLYQRTYAHECELRGMFGGRRKDEVEWPSIDDEDERILVGLMTRYPHFGKQGMDILRNAGVFEDKKRQPSSSKARLLSACVTAVAMWMPTLGAFAGLTSQSSPPSMPELSTGEGWAWVEEVTPRHGVPTIIDPFTVADRLDVGPVDFHAMFSLGVADTDTPLHCIPRKAADDWSMWMLEDEVFVGLTSQ